MPGQTVLHVPGSHVLWELGQASWDQVLGNVSPAVLVLRGGHRCPKLGFGDVLCGQATSKRFYKTEKWSRWSPGFKQCRPVSSALCSLICSFTKSVLSAGPSPAAGSRNRHRPLLGGQCLCQHSSRGRHSQVTSLETTLPGLEQGGGRAGSTF